MTAPVRFSEADFAGAYGKLLPPGLAWARERGSLFAGLVAGLAAVWARVTGRDADLLEKEAFPGSSTELLPDWERVAGLPDPCMAEAVGIVERRLAVTAKLAARGGQSVAYFQGLAISLGYRVEIRERSPFTCGPSELGVPYSGAAPAEMRFLWTVAIAAQRWTRFTCGVSQCGIDPLLRIALATDLECLIRRWKPAHTDVTFDYSGLDDHGFWTPPDGTWPPFPWPEAAWSAITGTAGFTYDEDYSP